MKARCEGASLTSSADLRNIRGRRRRRMSLGWSGCTGSCRTHAMNTGYVGAKRSEVGTTKAGVRGGDGCGRGLGAGEYCYGSCRGNVLMQTEAGE